MPSNRVGVVIPAGGKGQRTGFVHPKQFQEIKGVPLLLRTLRRFTSHPNVDLICVALPSEYCSTPPGFLLELLGDRLTVTEGGLTRAESVRRGVAHLGENVDRILVHDAARPFVSQATISACIQGIHEGGAVVSAVPITDTVKEVRPDGTVAGTLDRSVLWRAQTPQGATRQDFSEAYSRVEGWGALTDESALFEAAGIVVRVVEDLASNFKLTSAHDFDVAASLID